MHSRIELLLSQVKRSVRANLISDVCVTVSGMLRIVWRMKLRCSALTTADDNADNGVMELKRPNAANSLSTDSCVWEQCSEGSMRVAVSAAEDEGAERVAEADARC